MGGRMPRHRLTRRQPDWFTIDEAMRLLILAAAAILASVLAGHAPAAAQTFGQSCVLHDDPAAPGLAEPVRRFLERRPGFAVTTCASDRGVSHQAMSPVRVEAGV